MSGSWSRRFRLPTAVAGGFAGNTATQLSSQFNHSHDYWVADGNFPSIARTEAAGRGLLFVIERNRGCQQCREIANHTNQPVADIGPAEKQAVLGAIAEWEKPESGQGSR
ncbi:MAG: hypothetical protein ABSH00_15000 [Bryobacteraceae bacterium]|jgi:hypothetical protein